MKGRRHTDSHRPAPRRGSDLPVSTGQSRRGTSGGASGPPTLRLRIERLVPGGDGLAREPDGPTAGRVVLVPEVVEGDVVDVALVRERKRIAWGRVVRGVTPGPARVAPFCPLVERCGGCAWQHVAPSEQREARRGFVAEALRRVPTLDGQPIAVGEPPTDAESAGESTREGQRARVRLHIVSGRSGVVVGFHERGSRFIVDVERCPVAEDAVNDALAQLRSGLRQSRGARGTAVIVAGDGGDAAVSLRLDGAVPEELDFPDHVTRRLPAAAGGEVALRVSAAAFAQAHRVGNRALVRALLERWSGLPGDPSRTAELFAGGGNLTVPLATTGASVLAVEMAGASVDDLRHNVRQAGVEERVEILEGDARAPEVARELESFRPDRVVLDPPREGARELMPLIARLRPSAVVYVSCDPATLARDLEDLGESGYRLAEATAFHLFPETAHVETLAVMVRASE